jgi:YD repeat-containing protein
MRRIISLLLLATALCADTVNYTYDAAGRLAVVDYGNGRTITYVYDSAGNLLSRTATAASNSSADKTGAQRGKKAA